MARWAVLKFGGTSVRTLADWRVIEAQVRRQVDDGCRVLLVVSAVRGVTDAAVQLARGGKAAPLIEGIVDRYAQLAAELSVTPPLDEFTGRLRELGTQPSLAPPEEAELLGLGEYLTSRCGEAYLQQQGLDARFLDARDLLTTRPRPKASRSDYLAALCDPTSDPERADELAATASVWITQGFVARHPAGQPAVLGRGGSDTSAACLAALLGAERLQIWTDVPGMFSSDPRLLPGARLLRHVSYREAQELASMGARVLHPMSVEPVRRGEIPLEIRWTANPELPGTEISAQARELGNQVKGIVSRTGITLIAMEGFAMWHQVGFLADAFALFKKHGFSVDLVSTSEANVTLTLDPSSDLSDEAELKALVTELQAICQVKVITDCASVSLVGMGIRTFLHKLGPALEVFEQRHIYLVSQASNDLNLTFVVDKAHADKLVMQLHQQLIPGGTGGDSVFGPSWEQLHRGEAPADAAVPWWQTRREELLATMNGEDALFIYSRGEVTAAATRLAGLKQVHRVLYAMKANPHPELLRAAGEAGLGIECVSIAEVKHALASVPGLTPDRILFTPNFAPREEYQAGLALGVNVTVDNLFVLTEWGEDFAGKEVFVRLDPGSGLGHHKLVRTAGANSKFGIVEDDHKALQALAAKHQIRIVGLHAHVGSGVMHTGAWQRTLDTMSRWLDRFPDARVLDLGGGLGVPDRVGDEPLNLQGLDDGLAAMAETLADRLAGVEIWLEPGRYLVAEAGVLLARVTQLKGKGEVQYVGVATGMNSLIRPALYGAYHEIFNLSRLHEPSVQVTNVVGPICETGDILGLDRLLPASRPGDVLLVANAGAYAASMASRYNLREPAEERMIG
ncbi:MAG: bifunctional aspartate kinase/diaminopimelate decarboxylase [Pseudomonadota bacterium]